MVTDKSNETMRLALEALEKLNNTKSYWWQEVDEGVVVQLGNAETALREALAEQPAPVQGWRMVPVQPTDEMRDVGNVIIKDRGALFAAYRAMLDAAPQPAQQEPVAYWIPKAEQFCIASPSGRPFAKAWEPLYTSPPAQRKPLTNEEILAANYPDGEENGPTIAAPDFELICFARQIEAAHGIKEKT